MAVPTCRSCVRGSGGEPRSWPVRRAARRGGWGLHDRRLQRRHEGTVVAKNQNADDYACHAGGAMAAPAAVPVLRTCADPTCWQLVVRDSDGTVSKLCVSREEYDHTPVGAFWHGRTDR